MAWSISIFVTLIQTKVANTGTLLKEKSPVETGDVFDCLPYKKKRYSNCLTRLLLYQCFAAIHLLSGVKIGVIIVTYLIN